MADVIGVKLVGDPAAFIEALKRAGVATGDFSRGARRDLDAVQESSGALTQSIERLSSRGLSALAAYASFTALKSFRDELLQTQIASDKLQNTLSFAVGKGQVASEMVFLRETAQRLGLEFTTTSQQYAKLAAAARGTAIEGKAARDIFLSIAEASTVMGLSAEETGGALMAIQQMISKGTVQAEELRGQLGERLPGAFQIAARAMGVTTSELGKMLEQGQIIASDFLPKFAAQLKRELGDSATEAANSTQAAVNRMSTAWYDLKKAVNDSGVGGALSSSTSNFAKSLEGIAEQMEFVRLRGHGTTAQLLTGFGGVLQLMVPLIEGPRTYGEMIKAAGEKIKELDAEANKFGDNLYIQKQRKELLDFIADLQKLQKQLADARTGGAPASPSTRQFENQSMDKFTAMQAADESSLAKLRQQLSGQNANFQAKLTELFRLYQNGTISSLKTYQDMVAKLIETEGGVAKAMHGLTPGQAVIKSISEMAGELHGANDAQQSLTAAQKLAYKVLDDLRTGNLKATEAERAAIGVMLERLLTEDKTNTAREKAKKLREEEAKIIEHNEKMLEKENEAGQRKLEALIQDNAKMREEIGMIGLDEAARVRRLQLIEEEEIKRLELDLVMARNIEGNDAEIERLEREIKLRRERIGLIGDKGVADAAAKMAEEGKRAADSIGDTLTDALMRGFERGADFASNFRDTLKNMFKTLVLQPTIKAIVSPVASSISALFSGMNAPSGSGSAGAGIGANIFSSLASSAFAKSVMSYFGIGTGAAAAGTGTAAGAAAGSGAAASGGLAMSGMAGLIALGAMLDINSGKKLGINTFNSVMLSASLPGALTTTRLLQNWGLIQAPGGPKAESGYGTGVPLRGDATAAQQVADAITAGYKAAADSIGGIKDTLDNIGVFIGQDTKGTALTQLQVIAGGYNRGAVMGGGDLGENVARGDEALQKAEQLTITQAIFKGLQDNVKTGPISDYLKSIDLASSSIEKLQGALQIVQNVATFQAALKGLGASFQDLRDLSVENTEALAAQMGGYENLQAGVAAFFNDYFSEQEKQQILQQRLIDTFAQAGVTLPASIDAYKDAVLEAQKHLDSPEGRAIYATLINNADAFYQAAQATSDGVAAVSDTMQRLQADAAKLNVQLLAAQGDKAGAASAQRAIDTAGMTPDEIAQYDANQGVQGQIDAANERKGLQQQLDELTLTDAQLLEQQRNALDESNRALFDSVQAAKAAAKAAADEAAAKERIDNEKKGLQDQLDQLTMTSAQLLEKQRNALDESNRSLFDQVQAAQAAAAATQHAADVARERTGLEDQLLQLEGNTQELRARALAQLDESNRPLQEQIWALQDAAKAQEEAKRAEEERAQKVRALKDQWKSLTDSIYDEIARIKGLVRGDTHQGLAALQAQFAIATAAARSGDSKAYASLPQLSQQILELTDHTTSSIMDFQRIAAQIAGSLDQTAAIVSSRSGAGVEAKASAGGSAAPIARVRNSGGSITAPQFTTGGSGAGVANEELLNVMARVANAVEKQADPIRKIAKAVKDTNDEIQIWRKFGLPVKPIDKKGLLTRTS